MLQRNFAVPFRVLRSRLRRCCARGCVVAIFAVCNTSDFNAPAAADAMAQARERSATAQPRTQPYEDGRGSDGVRGACLMQSGAQVTALMQ